MAQIECQFVLALNVGSSSIRFAVFEHRAELARVASGMVSRIGQGDVLFTVAEADSHRHDVDNDDATDFPSALAAIVRWLNIRIGIANIVAVGYRVVHGGPRHGTPERVTGELLGELRSLIPFAPNHLPAEIAVIEASLQHFIGLPQIVCFDTAFHRHLPAVAQTLPIPRRYAANGVRRYGFHGLSYTFLLEELDRVAGADAARGRVILAHLGNGASLAAVKKGQCVDTSMGFTPTGGVLMGTRTGDLDPGVLAYLARQEHLSPDALEDLTSRQSGLLGISETTADMQTLLAREQTDPRAAEAVAVFCYQVRKWIGAFAAALAGIDTLVFAGGIGEHAPPVRSRICSDLAFLGIRLDEERNASNQPVISPDGSRVTVRVVPTDEEIIIARSIIQSLNAGGGSERTSNVASNT